MSQITQKEEVLDLDLRKTILEDEMDTARLIILIILVTVM